MSISTPAMTNFTAGEISPRLEGRVDISKYFNGCRTLQNFIVHAHGGASFRPGTRLAAEAGNPSGVSLLIGFEFNVEQSYILELYTDEHGYGKARVFKDGGLVLDSGTGLVYVFDVPWIEDDYDRLYWVQSNDTLYVVHPDYAPRTVTRADHDDWTVAEVVLTDQPTQWVAGNYPSVVCFFEERLVFAGTPEQPNTLWFSRSGEYTDFRLRTREAPVDEDWNEYVISDANADGKRDGKAGDTFLVLDGIHFSKGFVVKGEDPYGTTTYFRYLGTVDKTASGSDKTMTFAAAPSGDQVESIYDSHNALNTAKWEAFEVGERLDVTDLGLDPLDDDAIEVTLAARQSNSIGFIVPRKRMYCGTRGAEWTLGGGSTSEAISPASVKADPEGSYGCAAAMPVEVGQAAIYIQRAGRKLREMAYSFDTDSYDSVDLTILSEHITTGGMTQVVYAQEPDSVIYAVRADGVLLAMTYNRAQEVVAWSRIVTQGAVKRIGVIYDDASKRDQLWAVVAREIDGTTVHFVEYFEAMFEPGDTIENAYMVDCGLTYNGSPTSTVSGLDHLAGEEVVALADGMVLTDLTVAVDGTLALGGTYSVVHVGLPYTGILQPVRLEVGSERGTAQTKRKRITEVAIRFRDTMGGKVGPSATDLTVVEPLVYRTPADDMDAAVPLFSGDKIVKFPKGWDRDGLLTVIQDKPLPMTVVLIVPEVVINE